MLPTAIVSIALALSLTQTHTAVHTSIHSLFLMDTCDRICFVLLLLERNKDINLKKKKKKREHFIKGQYFRINFVHLAFI